MDQRNGTYGPGLSIILRQAACRYLVSMFPTTPDFSYHRLGRQSEKYLCPNEVA